MKKTRWAGLPALAAGVVVVALLPRTATYASDPPSADSSAPVPLLAGVSCTDLAPHGGSATAIPAGAIALPTTGGEITSATLVTAATTNGVSYPEYCDVKGAIHPVNAHADDIDFEVDIPTAWNGGAWQFGGAASDGSIPALTGTDDATPNELPPLAQGYAVYGGDSGHQVPGAGDWVTNDESWMNFAYQQIKKTHDASVWVMNALYGQGPLINYWAGSSQGGREGLEAATRYPDDYQGVAVEVPLAEFSNLLFNPGYQGQIQLRPGGYVPPSKAGAIASYVRSTCDRLDGLKDGVINDYLDCDNAFDATITPHPFAALRCTGAETDSCLTKPEITSLESFYSPIKYPYPLADGETEYPGWGTGMEDVGPLGTVVPLADWLFSATPPTAHDPSYFGGGGGVLGGQIAQEWFAKQLRKPDFSLLDIDLAKDKRQLQLLSRELDVSSDIHSYLADGGKLIMLTDASDAISNPRAQMDLYNEWLRDPVNGGAANVRSSVKYYVLPNQGHVGAGVDAQGDAIPNTVDLQGMIQHWVEDGTTPPIAPVAQTVSSPPSETAGPTKPVCLYPSYPAYTRGDPDSAASYTCRPARAAVGSSPGPVKRVATVTVHAGHPTTRRRARVAVDVRAAGRPAAGRVTVRLASHLAGHTATRTRAATLRHGHASVTFGRLPAATYAIRATYGGDATTASAGGRATLRVRAPR